MNPMKACAAAVILALPGCASNPSIHDVLPTLAVAQAVTAAACVAPNLSEDVKKACEAALAAQQVAAQALPVIVDGLADAGVK